MSGYKPYPKYKDSGIQWMREIPTHWNTIQSRRIFEQRKDRAFPDDEQLTASQKYGIVSQKEFMEIEGQKVVQVILGADILKHVEPNDFVISMRSFQGGIEYSPVRGCISSAYVMLIPSKVVYPPYFKWTFKSKAYIQALQATSNLVRDGQALRFENFTMVDLPVVPESEQKAIAKFLDRETSRIDTLIQEQRELIALLKEKRQAVISNAVTKGLNPKVKMKDSGVEWIGEMPAHWEVKKATHLFNTIGSGTTPKSDNSSYYDEGTIPWVNTGDLNDSELESCEKFVTDLAMSEHSSLKYYKSGSIVIAMYGATIGKLSILKFSATVNQACCVFSDPIDTDVRFVFYWLFAFRQQIVSLATGGGQPNISQDILRGLRLHYPPIREQNDIANSLEKELVQIDRLAHEAESAIELMLEHRASLISEAVTGKIDVRGINVK